MRDREGAYSSLLSTSMFQVITTFPEFGDIKSPRFVHQATKAKGLTRIKHSCPPASRKLSLVDNVGSSCRGGKPSIQERGIHSILSISSVRYHTSLPTKICKKNKVTSFSLIVAKKIAEHDSTTNHAALASLKSDAKPGHMYKDKNFT